MANSRSVSINLIGKPKVSFTADFLKWSMSLGRIVIAVTELIALSALAYRFYIDRKIIDLHDQIKREQLFVESQAPKEATYRSIQTRLANINQTQSATQVKITILDSILSVINSGNFTSTNLSIDQETIRFEGVAASIFPINSFIDTLKANPSVTSISLDDISSTLQGVKFKLSIELKK